MRPDAWLLNVGRGAPDRRPALIAALESGSTSTARGWTSPRLSRCHRTMRCGGRRAAWSRRTCRAPATSTRCMLKSALLLAEQLRRDAAGRQKLNVTSGSAGFWSGG
ncbi:MAG: hypothetical protein U0869_04850 [Chloroflexota bacterium]